MRYQLVLLIGLALIAIGLGLLMCVLAQCFPEDRENRPAPPDVLANRDAARQDALRRLADRQRLQRQREGSARISRGW